MARIKEEELRNISEEELVGQAKEYAFAKKQIEYFEKKAKELRENLFAHIEEDGEKDSDGHIILELPESVDGVVSIKKQRRVSRKVNEDAALEIIEAKGLRDRLIKTVEVIDEDELMAALYNDDLTEAEIDEMYPEVVTWALVLNKR